jgi:uncharacterized membrane protein YdjX (TVP38/TMEM64 family)
MKRKLIQRLIYIAITLIILYILVRWSGLKLEDLSEERIRSMTHDNLSLILLVMFGIMFLQNLLNVIPIVLVISANVALIGLWKGFAYSVLTSVIASTLLFLLFRYIFNDLKSPERYEKYLVKIERNGFMYILIARLIPIMPTSVINIAAGISTVKLNHYVAATFVGNTVYAFIIAFITSRFF